MNVGKPTLTTDPIRPNVLCFVVYYVKFFDQCDQNKIVKTNPSKLNC